MALKVLMLRKKINTKQKELDALRAKDAEFQTRETDLEKSIEEAVSEEERSAVDEAIAVFDEEKRAHEEGKAELERAIADLETELAAEEAAQDTTSPANNPGEEREHVEVEKHMITRDKVFAAMNIEQRAAMMERDDVKGWIGDIRTAISEKRALTNVGVTIPEVFLGVLRQNIENTSKLLRHVTSRPVGGNGRAVIMGAIPEAVWTDCCANLNELDLNFADMEFGCWKVGGFFAVCNATLEDSDLDLAAEVLSAIGQAIGKALDKAILYGTGTRMPLGIATRLAQTSEPAGYPATARPWVDLHTSNIKTIANTVTGAALFKQLLLNFGAAKGKYSRGDIVHVMNETTYTFLMAEALSLNAAGAIVTGINGSMPVIGGIIEVINDVPDYNIISGYFDLYTLAERAGKKFASSEDYKFLADQTVFKGTARYDGAPAIAEGFVVNAINSASAATSVAFPQDEENGVSQIWFGSSGISVAAGATAQLTVYTAPGTGVVTYASGTPAKATVGTDSGIVTGVSTGSSVITATCGDKTATITVTVTSE